MGLRCDQRPHHSSQLPTTSDSGTLIMSAALPCKINAQQQAATPLPDTEPTAVADSPRH